jgi:type IV pilus assembly protein PilX
MVTSNRSETAPARWRRAPRRQHGTVLIIALILLVLMTLIGVTSMQTTTLEEKMAGNSRDRTVALQAAESALRQGEENDAVIEAFNFDGTSGNLGQYDDDVFIDVFDNATWTSGSSMEYSGVLYVGPGVQVYEPSRYILQYRGPLAIDEQGTGLTPGGSYREPAKRHAVRVYSRGTGMTPETHVYLQSDMISFR